MYVIRLISGGKHGGPLCTCYIGMIHVLFRVRQLSQYYVYRLQDRPTIKLITVNIYDKSITESGGYYFSLIPC